MKKAKKKQNTHFFGVCFQSYRTTGYCRYQTLPFNVFTFFCVYGDLCTENKYTFDVPFRLDIAGKTEIIGF